VLCTYAANATRQTQNAAHSQLVTSVCCMPCTSHGAAAAQAVYVQNMCIGVYAHAPEAHSAGLRFLHLQRANAAPTPPLTAFMALLEIFVASCPL
jgi:hypothetical protein